MYGLVIFLLPNGTETGVGTLDELQELIADGYLPVGCTSRPATPADMV